MTSGCVFNDGAINLAQTRLRQAGAPAAGHGIEQMHETSRSQMHRRRLNHDACRRCVVRVRVSVVALKMNSAVEAQRRKMPVPQTARSPTVESTVKLKNLRRIRNATDVSMLHRRINGQAQRSQLQSGSPSSPTPTPTSCPSSPTTSTFAVYPLPSSSGLDPSSPSQSLDAQALTGLPVHRPKSPSRHATVW